MGYSLSYIIQTRPSGVHSSGRTCSPGNGQPWSCIHVCSTVPVASKWISVLPVLVNCCQVPVHALPSGPTARPVNDGAEPGKSEVVQRDEATPSVRTISKSLPVQIVRGRIGSRCSAVPVVRAGTWVQPAPSK